ncbi:MAG: hypothetical protein FAF05_01130 [Epsilonproteobacteria bacterium]|nr:hypothetical protein [Campylobacterota bacterium]
MDNYFDGNKLIKRSRSFYENGAVFRAYIEDETLFPKRITLKKITQKDIQSRYIQIRESIRELEKIGFVLEYEQKRFSAVGEQKVPVSVVFDTLEGYLQFVKKSKEFELFVQLYGMIVSRYPKLYDFIVQKPFVVLEYQNVWGSLLNVVAYLLAKDPPCIYVREIALEGIDTKFIQKYKKIIDQLVSSVMQNEPLSSLANYAFEKRYHLKYPQPLVRFRILDQTLYINGLSDLTLPLNQFQTLAIECKKVYIVENQITTLSFGDLPKSIVIFGQGYGGVGVLQNVAWLHNKEIIYWGDIDLDGFAILSRIRGYFSHVQSILMDSKTIQKWEHLSVSVPLKTKPVALPHLLDDEREAYEMIIKRYDGTFRLEQERIPLNYCKEHL